MLMHGILSVRIASLPRARYHATRTFLTHRTPNSTVFPTTLHLIARLQQSSRNREWRAQEWSTSRCWLRTRRRCASAAPSTIRNQPCCCTSTSWNRRHSLQALLIKVPLVPPSIGRPAIVGSYWMFELRRIFMVSSNLVLAAPTVPRDSVCSSRNRCSMLWS